ncbi:DsbA family protein [Aeromicrobium sp. Leaf350]|uniref:DsbA family protein n=1 Tax=Aeromicrobium sp. Leaf350 TaxID=2876565 RepID=UPI001E4BDE1C|nr:DsbA family protein [Aeromicrobium sp. Leaf350]
MSKDRQERAARAEQMRKEREKAAKRQRSVITGTIVAVVIVLVGLAAYGVSTISSGNGPEAFSVDYTPEDAGATPATDGYEPVVVEMYEDFQCPACQALESAFGEQLQALVAAGDITIKFHPFSFLDERGGSPNDYSKRATNAAICVYEEYDAASYKTFHDFLYANQPSEGTPGPEDEELTEAAESLGFTGVGDCISDHTYFDRISKAKEAGGERGVTGTPTIFIDDEQVEDNGTLIEQIQAAVAEKRGEPAPPTTDPGTAPTDAPTATTPAG